MAGGIIYEGNVSNSNTSEALMAERINENFNQAIDIIVKKRLEDLAFDKTEICLIEEVEEELQSDSTTKIPTGWYTVNNGSISYKVKARQGESYQKGQKVYVTIPNSDYENTKMIAGLYLDTEVDAKNYYVSIFDSFIDVTGNILNNNSLIDINSSLINREKQFTLLANDKNLPRGEDEEPDLDFERVQGASARYFLGGVKEDSILQFKRPLVGYDVFAISFDLKTSIASALRGVYSINVSLFYLDQDESNDSDWHRQDYSWSTPNPDASQLYSNFTGNPYNYSTFTTQQFKISLGNIPEKAKIMGMKAWIYQNGDFYYTSTGDEGTEIIYNEKIPDTFYNIAIKNFKMDFGFNPSASDFSNTDRAILSSPDNGYYTRTNQEDNFKRTITLNWVHVFQDDKDTIPMVINEKRDFTNYSIISRLNKVRITWYEWAEVASEDKDAVTNKFWKQIGRSYWTINGEILGATDEKWYSENAEGQGENFPFEITVNIAPNTSSVTYKAFIEYGLNLYKDLDNLDDAPKTDYVSVESDEFTFYATVPPAEGLQAKDFIEGLSLMTEDDDNRKGQYFLYEQETNLLFNSTEKAKVRKLRVRYNPAATGNIAEPQMLDKGTLYWKVPERDTMLSFMSPLERKPRVASNVIDENSLSEVVFYEEISWDDEGIKIIEEKFSEFDSLYKYYRVTFNNDLYKPEDLDYLNFTIKNQFVSTSRTNDVTCVLYDENDSMVCGGKFQFIFNYESAAKKVVNAYWANTELWLIKGNKEKDSDGKIVDTDSEHRGEILNTWKLFENPEALPVGGYLSPYYNIRYATEVGIQVFNYNNNPLFISNSEDGVKNLGQYISNPTITMGDIYNRQMNFSVFGQDVMNLAALKGESVDGINLMGSITIENAEQGQSMTLTNLVFKDNKLYYLSPLGSEFSSDSFTNKRIFPGWLEDAWPETIIFYGAGSDGENGDASTAPAALSAHFFRSDISMPSFWEDVIEKKVDDIFKEVPYNLLSGADLIVYDENRTLASSYSEGYQLRNESEDLSPEWRVVSLEKTGANTYGRNDNNRYFKFVSSGTQKNNVLQHTQSAIPIDKALFIEAVVGGVNPVVVYKLPLRVVQKMYGLSMLADWNGTNTPTIFGDLTNEGVFSGIFTGYNSIRRDENDKQITDEEVTSSTVAKENSSYGLFGYKDGQAIFALQQENPYFTIRDFSGSPLIQIADDGEEEDGTPKYKYFLQSANYIAPHEEDGIFNEGQGMNINLTDGTINSRNANSVLFASEIKARNAISIVDSENNVTVSIGEGSIITQTNETAEIFAGEKVYKKDEETGEDVFAYVKGLSISKREDEEEGTVTDVVLREAVLQDCVMEGTFQAESAAVHGITIANGTIAWLDDNNNQTALIKEGSLSGIEEISFTNESKLFSYESELRLSSDLKIKTGEDSYTSLINFISTINSFKTQVETSLNSIRTDVDDLKDLVENLEKATLKLPIKLVAASGNTPAYYTFDKDKINNEADYKTVTILLQDGEKGDSNNG